MGNGTSTDQGGSTPHGLRDVGEAAEFSNWSELAGAKQKESKELGRNPHISAETVPNVTGHHITF